MMQTLPHAEVSVLLNQCEGPQHNGPNFVATQFSHASHKYERKPAGLTTVGYLLPQIGLTKQTFKKLEAIQLIRDQRETGKQGLAYNARPFVLCGIPLRRPPSDQLTYLRHNGKFSLEITGHPRFGLPYGQDRLIPIWIATLALQQKSRVVHFETAAQMLDFFHLGKDGRHYRRIVEGFQRLFAATIFFGTEDRSGGSRLIDFARFHFFDNMRLWFADGNAIEVVEGAAGNTITLTEAFYEEISQHRIPVEREVVAALANAPGVLDFYIWLVWKSWNLRGRSARIPLFGFGGLAEQLGNAPYAVERTFTLTIKRWLTTVKALWPECPASVSGDGHALFVRSTARVSAIRGRSCE
jgi:hypothetical protein